MSTQHQESNLKTNAEQNKCRAEACVNFFDKYATMLLDRSDVCQESVTYGMRTFLDPFIHLWQGMIISLCILAYRAGRMVAHNTSSLVVPDFRAVVASTTSVHAGFGARARGSM